MRSVTLNVSDLKNYGGTQASLVFFVAITALSSLRSLAHIFLPDGGAGSIAGLATEGPAGYNIIAMFGQWGWSQLLLAVGMWLIVFYARALVPMGLLFASLDWGGRMLVGLLKPLEVVDSPPGQIGNYLLFPACVIALWFALPGTPKSNSTSQGQEDSSL